MLVPMEARSSNRISLSQFMVLVCILNICVLLSKLGRPNSTLRSNRSDRSSVGSKVTGLKIVDKSKQSHCSFEFLVLQSLHELAQGTNKKKLSIMTITLLNKNIKTQLNCTCS